ncbi:MAG: hypothetical protein ABSB35_31915 [Bryobacteraceae bacterium]
MRRVALIVLLSIAASASDDKDKARFAPGLAESYPNHQTVDKITIAAVPYVSEAQAHSAFDKANPNKYGVLPILVVIANGTGKALRLDLQAEFVEPDGKHLDATPALDVTFIGGSKKVPRIPGSSGAPFPLPRRAKGGPLDTLEITGRAFSAKLLPAGESVNGFFYFQTEPKPGTKLYLTGIKDAATGQDYFYYEIPL